MKRLASPKMRHVRALSPYSKLQKEGGNEKSFLSQYAMGGNPVANQGGPMMDINNASMG